MQLLANRKVISGFGIVSSMGLGFRSMLSSVFLDNKTNITRFRVNEEKEYPFAILPSEYNSADPSIILKLVDTCLNEVLITSHRTYSDLLSKRTALLMGVTSGTPHRWLGDQPAKYKEVVTNDQFIESRILREMGKQFSFLGPSFTVNTSCASSLTAIRMAEILLDSRMVDRVLIGAIEILNWYDVIGFSCARLLSEDTCRPFDVRRNGLMLGEAAVFALIERLTESKAPFFEILSTSVSNDGYDIAKPEPSGGKLKYCIQQSISKAGLIPNEIDYVNAHGTGTWHNDLTESVVYSELWPRTYSNTYINSTKGLHGHTRAAGGLLELLICGAAIQQNKIPFNGGVEQPDDSCAWHCGRVENCSRQVGRALSVSRGFGGHNVAAVISKIL